MAIPSTRTKFFAVLNRHQRDNNAPTVNPDDFPDLNPIPYSGVLSQRNTLVYLDSDVESNTTGRTPVFADRIDMATMTGISVEKGTATTFAELLPAINEAVGIAFTLNDFDPVTTVPASGQMTITASATNLIYFGAFTFTLRV